MTAKTACFSFTKTINATFLSFAFLLLTPYISWAQNDTKIEKLKKAILEAEDSVKVELMTDLSYQYKRISGDSMIAYAQKAKKLSEEINYDQGIFKGLYYSAHGYSVLGNYAIALSQLKEAKEVAKAINDLKLLSNAFNGLGNMYKNLGDYPAAIENYLECLRLREASKDLPGMAIVCSSIGFTYNKLGEHEKSETYLLKAVELNTITKDTISSIDDHINLGVLYENTDRHEEAIALIKNGIELAKAINDEIGLSILYGNLGNTYSEFGDFEKAIEYQEKALQIKLKRNRKVSIAYAYSHFQSAYFRAGHFNKSIEYGNKALDIIKENPSTEVFINVMEYLEQAHFQKKQYDKAYEFRTKLDVVKDSTFNAQKSLQVTQLQTLYETEKRDHRIEKQDREIELLATTNAFQRQLTVSISIALIFLFGIIYLYRSRLFATKARKIQEAFSQQLLSYQEDERQRISRDLHDSIGQSLVLIKNKVQLNNDQSTSNMISDTLEEVRNISKQLHPALLEKLGLTASIKKIAEEADKNSDIFFDIQLSNIDNFFSKENELHIYRIIQEATNNLVKHAKTPSATIITEELLNNIKISIIDYGQGFDLTENANQLQSLGMLTLKERTKILNGRLSIDSTKGKGTSIILMLNKSES